MGRMELDNVKLWYIEIICILPKLQICRNITTFLGLQKAMICWRNRNFWKANFITNKS